MNDATHDERTGKAARRGVQLRAPERQRLIDLCRRHGNSVVAARLGTAAATCKSAANGGHVLRSIRALIEQRLQSLTDSDF